jgi:putative pyruvate formate lyase activating enzyme
MDAYLPDLKTLDPKLSAAFFKAPDYPEAASAAILRMAALSPLRFGPSERVGADPADPGEVLLSGVVVRHLVLPDYLESTRNVLRWFADHCGGRALLSLMLQYTPVEGPAPRAAAACDAVHRGAARGDAVGSDAAPGPGVPQRFVNQKEMDTVLLWLEEFGIDDGFYQELVPDTEWLPDFNRENPFSSDLSVPVWHWKRGFIRGTMGSQPI